MVITDTGRRSQARSRRERLGPRMRPRRQVVRWRVVRGSDSDGEAEPPPWRAPLGNTGF
jgi:hypothetical protein